MSRPSHIIVSIPEPCKESWQEMTPNGCGRFCAHCEKTVIDFSGMDDGTMVDVITGATGAVCGRFNASQLNRPVIVPKERISKPFPFILSKVAASFLLLQTFVSNSFGQKQSLVSVEQSPSAKADNNSKLILKGNIQDFNTKMPLVGMEISVAGLGYVKYSDTGGHFQFVLPDSFRGRQITVTAKYQPSASAEAEGTTIREEYIVFNEGEQEKELQLYRYSFSEMKPVVVSVYEVPSTGGATYYSGGTVETFIRKKPNFFQRIGNIFKKKSR